MDSLKPLLQKFSTAALVLVPSASGHWVVSSWNPAFELLREGELDALKKAEAKTFLKAEPKTNAPLCQGKPVQPLDKLSIHTALLDTASNQQLRVKVKYDWLDDQTLLMWLEPFSEDMALTQAHADFVSTVSHEFRTPLTSIKGFADTLLRYGGNLDIDQQKRFINIIKHQADRLTRLVENLLTVSKLGAQKTQFIFRPIPLKKTVERIVQSVEGKLPDARVFTIQIADTLADVWADPDKLEQVLLNLIDNAAKYSYADSNVTVKAYIEEGNADAIRIDVSDEGVGIPAQHLPNIFNKFSRIDNPLTREVEGTGLGLYITKSLTTAMGGQISVASEDKKGTTFTVILPVASEERQAAARLERDEDREEGTNA